MIAIKIREIVPARTRRALSRNRAQKAIKMGIREIGEVLVETAKDGIESSPKTHKLYYYPGLGWVMSSKPFTYPADQTGRLKRSVITKTSGYTMWFGVTKQADYAKYLQQTDSPEQRSNWVKIAPRPMLTLSHNQNKNSFGDRMVDNMEKMMK